MIEEDVTLRYLTSAPQAAAPPPRARDWLSLLQRARNLAPAMDRWRRERAGRLRNAANALALGDGANSDAARSLARRALDLEQGTHARGELVRARLEKTFGSVEAARAMMIADHAHARDTENLDALQALRRRGEDLSAYEQDRDRRAALETDGLLGQALAGDVQAVLMLPRRCRGWDQEVARDLVGPLAAQVAFLVDLETYPDEGIPA
jgi:hypothetical protein